MPTKFVTITGFATWADEAAPGVPTHPIYVPPPADAHPEHPIVLPPLPPEESGGIPTHPIVLPPPLGIWGPTDPRPTPPIHSGPGGEPGGPPHIWGGGNVPMPSPPIYLPGPPPSGEEHPRDEWSWAFSPYYGWIVLPPETAARPKKGLPPTGQPKK